MGVSLINFLQEKTVKATNQKEEKRKKNLTRRTGRHGMGAKFTFIEPALNYLSALYTKSTTFFPPKTYCICSTDSSSGAEDIRDDTTCPNTLVVKATSRQNKEERREKT
jgi:hypothetical protein